MKDRIWRLTHFSNATYDYWSFFYLLGVASGPQKLITGGVIMADPPTAAWPGSSDVPNFDTEVDARAWASENDFDFIAR